MASAHTLMATAHSNRQKRAAVFRVGETVRVVVPSFVKRVGYPKSVADYLPIVHQHAKALDALFATLSPKKAPPDKRLRKGVEYELAHVLARQDRFGGTTRSIHLVDVPEYAGRVCHVVEMRTAMTGEYERGGGLGEDYEPNALANRKARRIAMLDIFMPSDSGFTVVGNGMGGLLSIPIEHLEKVKESLLKSEVI